MTSKNGQTIGPASADLLQALTSYDLRALTFGRSAFVPLEGINVHVARGGYTGEDGFEVGLPIHWLLARALLIFLLTLD
jgi:glycine cleavage system aminomethyltransferase T